jgi:hypothetical protein
MQETCACTSMLVLDITGQGGKCGSNSSMGGFGVEHEWSVTIGHYGLMNQQ